MVRNLRQLPTYLSWWERNRVRFVFRYFISLIIIPFLALLISCTKSVEEEKSEKAARVRVRTSQFKKSDYEFTLDFSGEVKAWKSVNMSFNVPGKIDSFYFDEGHRVKKGDLLARLEQEDFRAVRDHAHAQWEKAKRDYERSRRLWKEGSIREQIVQDAHTAFKAAGAALEAAELNLKHCLLYAPFSGHVAYRYGEEKEMVAGGQTVLTLMDLSRVIVELGVPEKNIEKIVKEQEASIRFEAIPEKSFSGRVSQVAVSSFPNTRLFKVEITVQNLNLAIRPGMTALSSLVTDKMNDVFIFPLDVAVLRNGARVIYLASDGRAKEVILKNYIISGDKIIVRDPLPEGSRVISSGQDVLFDNMKILIVEEGQNQ